MNKFTILRPGGNDQMLIEGIVKKSARRKINDEMIKQYSNVEQVSFFEYDAKNKKAKLELAGGEFCGNATRSLAYLLLGGKPGQISIKVSGTKKALEAGINQIGTAYAQMPIKDINSIRKINTNLFRIDLEGIVQLVCLDDITGLNPKKLKSLAYEILKKEDLILSEPAAGVMFIKEYPTFIKMKPVVWVRDIETLLYETACASGTAAVGAWRNFQNPQKETMTRVMQPSGKFIEVSVYQKDNSLKVYIDGQIEILMKGGENNE